MTIWSKNSKPPVDSLKTAIACGMVTDIPNGSLWYVTQNTSNFTYQFVKNRMDNYANIFKEGTIVMVYNVQYHRVEFPNIKTAKSVWNITFDFLIGETMFRDYSLWHDEWRNVFRKATPDE